MGSQPKKTTGDQPKQSQIKLPPWLAKLHRMDEELATKDTVANDEQQPQEPAAPDEAALKEQLHEAVVNEDAPEAAHLITDGVVPDTKTLDHAASNSTTGWITVLLEAGAQPTPETLDIIVKRFGDEDDGLAAEMIAKGVVSGTKPLDYAAADGTPGLIKMLLDAGAKPTAETLDIIVKRFGDKEGLAAATIEAGAVPAQKTLDYVVSEEWTDLEKLLIKAMPHYDKNKVAEDKLTIKELGESKFNELSQAPETPPPAPALTAQQKKLHEAAVTHDWSDVEQLINDGVVPAQKTLAFVVDAGSTGWPRWASALIEAGAIQTAEMVYNATVNHDWLTAQELIQGGATVDDRTLAFVVKEGSKDWAGWAYKLIDAGAKPTPFMLYTAIVSRDWEMADDLVSGGAQLDEKILNYAKYNELRGAGEALSSALKNAQDKPGRPRQKRAPRTYHL